MPKFKKMVKILLMAALTATPNVMAKTKIGGFGEIFGSKKIGSKRHSDGLEDHHTYNDYFNHLSKRESSNNPQAVNQYGYLGKYQMGESALIQAGFYKYDSHTKHHSWNGVWTKEAQEMMVASKQAFLNNESAQDFAVRVYTEKNWDMIASFGLDRYVGKTVNGVEITASGMLAGAHLVGIGGLRDFIQRGEDKKDGNGVPVSNYIKKFAGYETPFADEDLSSYSS